MKMIEKFLLLCNCGWKKISDLKGDIGAVEIKNDTLSARKFRCPSCGFAVAPRKIKDPQLELDRANKDKEMIDENKKWLEESIEKQSKFIKEMQDGEEDSDQ
jgi:hypothetical protein